MLAGKAYRAMGWSGGSGVVANGLELLKYVILARMLPATDFGWLAMVMVVIGITRLFADGGLSNAIIHYRLKERRLLTGLLVLQLAAGIVLYGVVWLTAPLFARFWASPEITDLLRLAGLLLPLISAGALYEVILRKELAFKHLAGAEILASATGFAVAIALAWQGFGVMALIWGHLAAAAILTTAHVALGLRLFRPSRNIRFAGSGAYLRFGLYQMGERALNVYAMRVDQLIIGRFFGPDILGGYYLAWQLILFPVQRMSPLLNRVAFPVFASIQNQNDRLAAGYLKLMNGVLAMGLPFMLFGALSAPWLIVLLLGTGWELTVQLTPFMALLGIMRLMGNPSGTIVLSKGRAGLVFWWNLAVALFNTLVFFWASQYTIFVLAGSQALLNVIYFTAGQWLMVNRLIDLTWRRFFASVGPFMIATVAGWAVALLVRNTTSGIWRTSPPAGESWWRSLIHSWYAAWENPAMWLEQALFSPLAMLMFLAGIFLILYVPAVALFQRKLAGEIFRNLIRR